MASTATMIAALRGNAAVLSTEYADSVLTDWVQAALYQHNRRYTVATLPANEVDAVIFLAWIKLCYARAATASQYFSISGRSGSVNKGEMVGHNLEMLRFLREEYITLCQRIGVNPAPEIIVSDFTILDESQNVMTPTSAHIPPITSVVGTQNYTGTTLDLYWSEAQPGDTFLRYRVFYGTEEGLADLATLGDLEAEYPGIDEDKATLLVTYIEKWRVACRVTGLTAGTHYYFIVMVEDINGRFAISDEVSTDHAPAPAETVNNFQWYTDPATGKQCLRLVNDQGETLSEFSPTGV